MWFMPFVNLAKITIKRLKVNTIAKSDYVVVSVIKLPVLLAINRFYILLIYIYFIYYLDPPKIFEYERPGILREIIYLPVVGISSFLTIVLMDNPTIATTCMRFRELLWYG